MKNLLAFLFGFLALTTVSSAAQDTNGSVQYGNFFTGYANVSGQKYTSTPRWSVAGVNYGVGVENYIVARGYLNPATTQPAGCTYSARGDLHGTPQLTCNNAANCAIEGYDFTGVYLRINSNCIGTTRIINNKFKLTSAMVGANLSLIYANDLQSSCFDVENNTFDGQAFVLGTTVPVGGTNALLLYNRCSSNRIYRNAFLEIPGRPLIYAANSMTGHMEVIENFIRDFTPYQPQGHGEFGVTNSYPFPSIPGFGGVWYSYNTVLQLPGGCSCGAASFFVTSGAGQFFTNVRVDHNVVVANGVAGGPVNNNFALVGKIDNGSRSGAGHVLTVTSATATIRVGQLLTSGAIAVSILSNISGSGAGSKWNIADDTSYTPSYSTGSRTFSVNSASLGAALFEITTDIYTNRPTVTDNFMDLTGALTSSASNSGSSCPAGPAVFSGNVNMVSGAAISTWGQAGSATC